MGRERQYTNNAERQRAYRQRKAAKDAKPSHRSTRRRTVSEKLVKVLGLLGSDHAGERDNAARKATQILKEAHLTWYDVLDVE